MAIGVIVVLVLSMGCVWMCTLGGGRCAVPCCKVFLAEQDNIVLRLLASARLSIELQKVESELVARPETYATLAQKPGLQCLDAVVKVAGSSSDPSSRDVERGDGAVGIPLTKEIFRKWASVPITASAQRQAEYFMTPKPGDDIEQTETISKTGDVLNAYPTSWKTHVRVARAICDSLQLLSTEFSSRTDALCKIGVHPDSVRKQINDQSPHLLGAIDTMFQQAKWCVEVDWAFLALVARQWSNRHCSSP